MKKKTLQFSKLGRRGGAGQFKPVALTTRKGQRGGVQSNEQTRATEFTATSLPWSWANAAAIGTRLAYRIQYKNRQSLVKMSAPRRHMGSRPRVHGRVARDRKQT